MMDVPEGTEIWGQKWRRGAANFTVVAELFQHRNLWAISAIAAGARRADPRLQEMLLFTLTAMMLNSSRMYRYRISGKGGFQSGNYYIPPLSQNMNAGSQLVDKERDLLGGQEALRNAQRHDAVCVYEGNSSALQHAAGSVDYVFTDPPYLNVETQYGEMNFVWNAWLDQPARDLSSEISLSPIRGMTWEVAEQKFRDACFKIAACLKPGRFASFCYHDTSERNWHMVQEALLDAGLTIESGCSFDPRQKSQKQITKEKIVKSDLVINCRKPRPGESRQVGQTEAELVSKRVREIVVETLSMRGGQPRDKLWDITLKRLLSRGQMAEHRFDDLLGEVATRSESGRWFIKEEFESLSESDLRNEEEAGRALGALCSIPLHGVPVSLAAQMALDRDYRG